MITVNASHCYVCITAISCFKRDSVNGLCSDFPACTRISAAVSIYGMPILSGHLLELFFFSPVIVPATAGNDAAWNDAAGNDAAGNDAAWNDAAWNDAAWNDAAGNDAAGNDAAWNDAAGNDAAGNDAAWNDAAGNDAAGNDAAGNDAAWNDAAGNDAAGNDAEACEYEYTSVVTAIKHTGALAVFCLGEGGGGGGEWGQELLGYWWSLLVSLFCHISMHTNSTTVCCRGFLKLLASPVSPPPPPPPPLTHLCTQTAQQSFLNRANCVRCSCKIYFL